MRIGLLTNALAHAGVKDLRAVAGWARENGFEALEVCLAFQRSAETGECVRLSP